MSEVGSASVQSCRVLLLALPTVFVLVACFFHSGFSETDGSVTDDHGLAIADAEVVVQYECKRPALMDSSFEILDFATTTTDAKGMFHVPAPTLVSERRTFQCNKVVTARQRGKFRCNYCTACTDPLLDLKYCIQSLRLDDAPREYWKSLKVPLGKSSLVNEPFKATLTVPSREPRADLVLISPAPEIVRLTKKSCGDYDFTSVSWLRTNQANGCVESIRAAGYLGPEAADLVPVITDALRRSLREDDRLQRVLLWSLGRMGRAAASAVPLIIERVEGLRIVPSSTPAALQTLERIGDGRGDAYLTDYFERAKLLLRKGSDEQKLRVIASLALLESPRSREILTSFTLDENAVIASAAKRTLAATHEIDSAIYP